MKLLFLRGKVDKRTPQVRTLEEHTDGWTHLAYALAGVVQVWYWGGTREYSYGRGMDERWIYDFKHSPLPDFQPDVIFCRGGFPQYQHVLRRFPRATTIYYGAGKRFMPDGRYDLVLVDDPQQQQAVKDKYPHIRCHLWEKPAAPHFAARDVVPKYDLCYIANGQQSGIKNIKWVYETLPSHYKLLHLGYKSKHTVPQNVVQERVDRSQMPAKISLCRVGIVPYTSYDSAPRALIEMASCGLPIVALESTHQHYPSLNIKSASVSNFWVTVATGIMMAQLNSAKEHSQYVRSRVSIETAAAHIRAILRSMWHE